MISKLFGVLAVPILEWLHKKISAWLFRALQASRENKAIESANAEIRRRTEEAQTREERIEAARDTINRL